jgi:hypothetical protein
MGGMKTAFVSHSFFAAPWGLVVDQGARRGGHVFLPGAWSPPFSDRGGVISPTALAARRDFLRVTCPGFSSDGPRLLFISSFQWNASMNMNQLLHKIINVGQAADLLCRALPDNHRLRMALRDLHTQISIAMLSMSESIRNHIACN